MQDVGQVGGLRALLGLAAPAEINHTLAEATAEQITIPTSKQEQIQKHILKVSSTLSSSRNKKEFGCSLCSYQTKYEAICMTHIEKCLMKLHINNDVEEPFDSESKTDSGNSAASHTRDESNMSMESSSGDGNLARVEEQDKFWNYKCSEFMLDSLFALSTVYEKHGDGLGMFIISKMLLPILHGLRHSNYTMSIHRFICRVLCEASPREALKLIHERFSNKEGKVAGNIFKDR